MIFAHPKRGSQEGSFFIPKEIRKCFACNIGITANNETDALPLYQRLVLLKNKGKNQNSHVRFDYYKL